MTFIKGKYSKSPLGTSPNALHCISLAETKIYSTHLGHNIVPVWCSVVYLGDVQFSQKPDHPWWPKVLSWAVQLLFEAVGGDSV